jgi:bifunctional non-homologous end joining protein LigD
VTGHFAVIGAARVRGEVRSLRLARLAAGELVPCGGAPQGLCAKPRFRGQIVNEDG